ncbi:MAG: hypothetical protein AAB336_12070 [Acidobacteriota bacterium]
MNSIIAQELEILWSDFNNFDVDEKLEAFERLKISVSKDDLPQLVSALKSERNDFWTRELLSEPISILGGSKYLPELFEALQQNYDEGHDNDGFCFFLVEMAESETELCKKRLLELIDLPNFKHKKHANWLLEFCG